MIDAKELRIGNWYNFHNAMNGEKALYQFNNWSEYLDFEAYGEPIPLSPDVLSRCMTKVSDKEFKIELPVDYHGGSGVYFIVKWYEYNATGEHYFGWRPYTQSREPYQPDKNKMSPMVEIFLWGYLETLHQLQNYYHSIVGKELTYTP